MKTSLKRRSTNLSNGVNKNIRNQFPILRTRKALVYFDNAATTQKPDVVLKAMDTFYRSGNAPVHRSVYALGERDGRVRTCATTVQSRQCHASRGNYFHGRDDGKDKYDSARLCGVAEARGHHPALRHGTPRDDSPWQPPRSQGAKGAPVPLTTDGRIDMGVFKGAHEIPPEIRRCHAHFQCPRHD